MWKLGSPFLDPPQSFGGANDIDPESVARRTQVAFGKLLWDASYSTVILTGVEWDKLPAEAVTVIVKLFGV
jgi:hypothetical protein